VAVPVRRLGVPDRFIEHGPRALLLELNGLTAAGIAASAAEVARHPACPEPSRRERFHPAGR